jgi:hypothetical protein
MFLVLFLLMLTIEAQIIQDRLYDTSCATKSSGAMFCWGENGDGQIGDGTTQTPKIMAIAVSEMSSGVVGITGGLGHICAV